MGSSVKSLNPFEGVHQAPADLRRFRPHATPATAFPAKRHRVRAPRVQEDQLWKPLLAHAEWAEPLQPARPLQTQRCRGLSAHGHRKLRRWKMCPAKVYHRTAPHFQVWDWILRAKASWVHLQAAPGVLIWTFWLQALRCALALTRSTPFR